MRILLIGSGNPWRMEAAVERAFRRAGHETLLLDDRQIKRTIGFALAQRWVSLRARNFAPDFIFLSKCHALEAQTVERIIQGKPNAMWYHDPQWHRDLDRPDIAHIATIGRLADSFFVTGFDAEWRANGLRAKLLPAAGDAAIEPVPYDPRFAADVTFIGTGYDPERAKLLLEIARHERVRVWGLGWEPWKDTLAWGGRPVENHDFAAVCSSSKITLGINPARAKGATAYTSDRLWMVMLAGGFYLGPGTPGLNRMLQDGLHCAFYRDVPHCVEQAHHYVTHDEERERIRAAGERYVRSHHTYDQRAPHLLSGEPYRLPA
jgi:hypothetical protein